MNGLSTSSKPIGVFIQTLVVTLKMLAIIPLSTLFPQPVNRVCVKYICSHQYHLVSMSGQLMIDFAMHLHSKLALTPSLNLPIIAKYFPQ